ncbi:TIR domain-containing protein [Psychromonas aquimarina]|uniref:TIR domain-containing protein n=1 Tax=Psychromonas aquimarina TaxID=444919 RepID=UPI00146FAF90|nr:TIR domain-containing protein [Psychromonas aquimarina]
MELEEIQVLNMEINMERYKYKAFISYSHRDCKWGAWLHKALETYKIPKDRVGSSTCSGTVPKRLIPVFLDKEELPTASSLGKKLTNALEDSQYLIVICSPNSATSQWVNEEVRLFKAMGRMDRVLAIIVGGEPGGDETTDPLTGQCFPAALRFEVNEDGSISTRPTEPISADVRSGKGGKQAALLKLVAGLTGIAYADLAQRQKQRRRQFQLQALAGISMVSAVAIFLTTQWYFERQRTRELVIEKKANAAKIDFLGGDVGLAVSRWGELTQELGKDNNPYTQVLSHWTARLKPLSTVLENLIPRQVYQFKEKFYYKVSDGRLLDFGGNKPLLWAVDDGHLYIIQEEGVQSWIGRVINLKSAEVKQKRVLDSETPTLVMKPDLIPGMLFYSIDGDRGRYDRLVYMNADHIQPLFPNDFYTEVLVGEPCNEFLQIDLSDENTLRRSHFKDGRFVEDTYSYFEDENELPSPGQQERYVVIDDDYAILYNDDQGDWGLSLGYGWVRESIDEQCEWASQDVQSHVLSLPALIREQEFWLIQDKSETQISNNEMSFDSVESTDVDPAERWAYLKKNKVKFHNLSPAEQVSLFTFWAQRSDFSSIAQGEELQKEFFLSDLEFRGYFQDLYSWRSDGSLYMSYIVDVASGAGIVFRSLFKIDMHSGKIVAMANYQTDGDLGGNISLLPDESLFFVGLGGIRGESFYLFDAKTLENITPPVTPPGAGNFDYQLLPLEQALYVHVGKRIYHYVRPDGGSFQLRNSFQPDPVKTTYEYIQSDKVVHVDSDMYEYEEYIFLNGQDFVIYDNLIILQGSNNRIIAFDRHTQQIVWEYQADLPEDDIIRVLELSNDQHRLLVCSQNTAMLMDSRLGLPLTGQLLLQSEPVEESQTFITCAFDETDTAVVTVNDKQYRLKQLNQGLTLNNTYLTERTMYENKHKPLTQLPEKYVTRLKNNQNQIEK